MQYVEHRLIQAVPHLEPVVRTYNKSNHKIDTRSRWTEINGRARTTEPAQPPLFGHPLPLVGCQVCVLLRFREHRFVDQVDRLTAVGGRWNIHSDLIPHPLPTGRKIEELPGDRKLIHKCDSSARRV